MTAVRLLIGTRKGAFVLTSDERRQDWKVTGPHFAGWEMYHLKASPADRAERIQIEMLVDGLGVLEGRP